MVRGKRGKSTFIKTAFVEKNEFSYVNLDDLNLLRLAKSDPITFVAQLNEHAAIDEIQRTPELLLPIKKMIDEARETRRFLLTGSANILTLPKLSESLAGRMEIHTLWPLSQGEIRGIKEKFIDFAFSDAPPQSPQPFSQTDYLEAIIYGGYPEALAQMRAGRGPEWFNSYLATILQRDIQEISRIEGLADLPNLLEIIASRAGNLINVADISRITRLNAVTLKRYMTLLEMVFLIVEIPAWARNAEKRFVKSPKVFVNDTGLLCYLRGLNQQALERERSLLGSVLENFVVMELAKQCGWAELKCGLLHFRTHGGDEVDIVLEAADKRVTGVEVKASMDVNPSDFSGLRALSKAAGDRFHRGFLLYTGNDILQYANNLWALPICSLWNVPHQGETATVTSR
ncbi:ATP-binding protein [Geminisphaera colitermitum]|uniref:ATP-binding protein n=1 Tax=Geminisphaera colitermitum TaxID=1148786 RepID=UPI000158CCFE|nr:ATP-binding protein [Geminisphaera colitermitum]